MCDFYFKIVLEKSLKTIQYLDINNSFIQSNNKNLVSTRYSTQVLGCPILPGSINQRLLCSEHKEVFSQGDMVFATNLEKVVIRNSLGKELEGQGGLPKVVASPFMHSFESLLNETHKGNGEN